MAEVAFIKQGDNLVIILEGETFNVGTDHPNYYSILMELKTGEADPFDLLELIDVPRTIAAKSDGKVEVVDGTVMYDGQIIHNALTMRLLDMLEEGFNVDPLLRFLDNLMDNPSKRAVDELYLFLEANSLPITPDGHFLAYKNVNSDYRDIHSNTFDNSVGQIVEMPRNRVDDQRDRTCSYGLHFCSLSYLKSFGGAHTMILKINPADVVSIPSDYNNQKGRCCRYEVVGEHTHADRYTVEAFDKSVVEFNSDRQPAGRAVMSIDEDGFMVEEFDSVEEAAACMDCPESYITRVLRGDRARTMGYGWVYADDYEEPSTAVTDPVDSWVDDDWNW